MRVWVHKRNFLIEVPFFIILTHSIFYHYNQYKQQKEAGHKDPPR